MAKARNGMSDNSRSKSAKSQPIAWRPESSLNYDGDLGDPGCYPFTRGIHPEMYARRLWTIRQYAGFATAEESNRRYKYLLKQGTTGLSVAFDLPTQIGLDSDHPQAAGEVGRVGVAIDSLRDMEILCRDIPLSDVSTSMTINSTAAILLALYLCVAKQQGCGFDELRGTVQNDILKEYVARGTYIFPPGPSLRLVTDLMAFCHLHVPRWNTISISGYHIREAGATAAQEVAFTLANAETYSRAALSAGLEVDDFAPRFSFFFNSHNDLFEEVAKFRAARRLWARLMREDFKARNPRSWKLRFHTQTAGSTLTSRQPENNTVRVAYQALAAVLGGTQSLHTNARDEALALPTEESARLALRTQQILAFEVGLSSVADPLGGSWYVESLTDEIEGKAAEYMTRIRDMGGVLKAIENGFVQKEIQDSAYLYQKAVEAAERVVVGVNRFQEELDPPVEILRIDPDLEKKQIAALRRLRKDRAEADVQESLEAVRTCAEGTENLMPALIRAVQAYATIGEISDALRDVFGEFKESVFI